MANKILTIDDLVNSIDNDLAWRKKEIHYIKTLIPKEKSVKQSSYLRLAVPLLYAHWEGFAKSSTEAYLKYVSLKNLRHTDLRPQFIALSLSKLLGLSEIKNLEGKTTIVNALLLKLNDRAQIPTKEIIQTKSNLRYDVFREIIFTLSLSEERFCIYKSFIDDLVDTRNHIAHGNYLKVEYKECISMCDDLTTLLEMLKNEILNSAVLELFKTSSEPI